MAHAKEKKNKTNNPLLFPLFFLLLFLLLLLLLLQKKGEGIKGKKRGNRKEEEEKIREMRKYPAVCIRVCAYWTGGWGDLFFLLSPSLRRLRRRDLDGGGRWVVEEVKRRNSLQWPGLIRRWRSACAHRRPPPSPPRPPPRCLRATPQTPSFFVIFLIRQRPLCMFPLSFSLTRFPFLMGWIQPSLVGVGGRRRASEQLFFLSLLCPSLFRSYFQPSSCCCPFSPIYSSPTILLRIFFVLKRKRKIQLCIFFSSCFVWSSSSLSLRCRASYTLAHWPFKYNGGGFSVIFQASWIITAS